MNAIDAGSLTVDQIAVASVLGLVLLSVLSLNLVLAILLWSSGARRQARCPQVESTHPSFAEHLGVFGQLSSSLPDLHESDIVRSGRHATDGTFSAGDGVRSAIKSRRSANCASGRPGEGDSPVPVVDTRDQACTGFVEADNGTVEKGERRENEDLVLVSDLCSRDSVSPHSEEFRLTLNGSKDIHSNNSITREVVDTTEQDLDHKWIETGKRRYRNHKQTKMLSNYRGRANKSSSVSPDSSRAPGPLHEIENKKEGIMPGLEDGAGPPTDRARQSTFNKENYQQTKEMHPDPSHKAVDQATVTRHGQDRYKVTKEVNPPHGRAPEVRPPFLDLSITDDAKYSLAEKQGRPGSTSHTPVARQVEPAINISSRGASQSGGDTPYRVLGGRPQDALLWSPLLIQTSRFVLSEEDLSNYHAETSRSPTIDELVRRDYYRKSSFYHTTRTEGSQVVTEKRSSVSETPLAGGDSLTSSFTLSDFEVNLERNAGPEYSVADVCL
ncbi:hypothetical protein EGW08_003351 [Elysia chlorotica]|uniref:Uncharacterized protein n=1 Tax=Elysia chlorotica TaxID=188477 RepID=A0A3S1BI76_ELYCH|nr:hypothetical protein EGW08_003351 [Elysia chlorotica]